MNYDIDAKIEEIALDLASDRSLSLEELEELRRFASNQYSANVMRRAIELREAGTMAGSSELHC